MQKGLIEKENCCLVVLDIQSVLLPQMHSADEMLTTAAKMIKFCKLLNIPILLTEQYPKGLGRTEESIRRLLPEVAPIEKVHFSCFRSERFVSELERLRVRTVMVVGMETHICVLQTTLDGLASGYDMYLIADGITSISEQASELALRRLAAVGAQVSCLESAMFEILKEAKTAEFAKVFELLKR